MCALAALRVVTPLGEVGAGARTSADARPSNELMSDRRVMSERMWDMQIARANAKDGAAAYECSEFGSENHTRK